MASDPVHQAERIPGPSVVRFGFDVLDRVEQAVAMVKERLTRAVSALETAGIPHAVAGGNAVAAWVSRIDPVAAPDLSATDLHEGYRIVDLDRLITMKLTAFRLKDRVHLLDMIEVGLIDEQTVARLPEVLRPRLEELLANPDGRHRAETVPGTESGSGFAVPPP